jgi:hypothetical protein
VLKGDDRPADSTEALAFAEMAYYRKQFTASARLCAEASGADPKMADARKAGPRYRAACSAALAGTGEGQDDPPRDEAGRAKLRQQAREWLRANLAPLRQQVNDDTVAARSKVRAELQIYEEVDRHVPVPAGTVAVIPCRAHDRLAGRHSALLAQGVGRRRRPPSEGRGARGGEVVAIILERETIPQPTLLENGARGALPVRPPRRRPRAGRFCT